MKTGSNASESESRASPAALSGPSYSLPLKVVVTLVVVGLAGLILVLAQRPGTQLPPAVTGLLVAALLVVLAGWWDVMRGRTSIDDRFIRQAGLWTREVKISSITGCQLVYFPRWAWLIAPRLIVRSGGYGVKTFYACDPDVLRAFGKLVERRPE